jgi:hypothetical protein
LEAYEFLAWRVGQTYYVNLADDPAQHDPNYVSSNFSPGNVPSHISPVKSRLRFQPNRQVTSNLDVEYDVNYKALSRLALSTTFDDELVRLSTRWSRRYDINDDGAVTITTGYETLCGAARVSVLPSRLSVHGSADYNIFNKKVIHASGRVRYDAQCCGFMAEVVRTNEAVPDTRVGFSIELANIGAMGSFNSEEEGDRRLRNPGSPP